MPSATKAKQNNDHVEGIFPLPKSYQKEQLFGFLPTTHTVVLTHKGEGTDRADERLGPQAFEKRAGPADGFGRTSPTNEFRERV